MAQLKQLVERPDLVEMHDVAAHDPRLLIHLKVRWALIRVVNRVGRRVVVILYM